MLIAEENQTRIRRPHPVKAVKRAAAGTSEMDTEAESGLSDQTIWLIAVRDQRDRACFVRLFEFYAPRLRSMLARSGCTGAAADDIIQDAMLKVWHKAEQFDPTRATASAWVYRIARNCHIDVIRRTSRPIPEALKIEEHPDQDATSQIALNQEARKLRQALDSLSADQREVIVQAYMGDLSHSEISDNTGLPLGTIKSRIRLTLEKLRHEMKDLRSQ